MRRILAAFTEGRWRSLLPLVPAVLGVACFASSLSGGFVYDDNQQIVTSTRIHSGSLRDILFGDVWGEVYGGSNYYRPLALLLWRVLYALFGADPLPFHAVGVALHAATASMVFLVARRLFQRDRAGEGGGGQAGEGTGAADWLALAAGALFAVHPAHVEAVAWISAVMDLLATPLSLLYLYLYLGPDGGPRPRARWLGGLALFLALLSKESAAAAPLILAAVDLVDAVRLARKAAGLDPNP